MARKLPVEAAPQFTDCPFARIAGRDAPMHLLLAEGAEALAGRKVRLLSARADPLHDYAQIDPTLARLPFESLAQATLPPERWPSAGVGYVGLSAKARTHFLQWLATPERPAPPAFQSLYLAQIETCLIEAVVHDKPPLLEQAIAALRALEAWPEWRSNEQRTRTTLFAFVLLGDGLRLATWLAEGALDPQLLGVALGLQARWDVLLRPAEVLNVASHWGITDQKLDENVVALRLRSLSEGLGADPLAYALRAVSPVQPEPDASTGDEKPSVVADFAALPWRCAHRDLRPVFAQPNISAQLAPLFAEMLDDVPVAKAAATASAAMPEVAPADEWSLILEFGHSRSEYFEFALKQAQRMPGYSALVDEQRHVVHRVQFKKSEMRRFWQLWEYAVNWNETHVYLNGKELEKWKVYPYSQFIA